MRKLMKSIQNTRTRQALYFFKKVLNAMKNSMLAPAAEFGPFLFQFEHISSWVKFLIDFRAFAPYFPIL